MGSATDFQADSCDLCGSNRADVLLQVPTGRALRSDGQLMSGDLLKMACAVCGLVRTGQSLSSVNLRTCYEQDYAPAAAEYTFHTSAGPVRRSTMFADWLTSAMGAQRFQRARRCLEIGAGAGALLGELQQRFPGCTFEGLELSAAAVEAARATGRNVRQALLEDLDSDTFDIVYAIAVLEHVPSPTRFLAEIRRRLAPGGWLYLCQPTQDVQSYDVFFVDHLHHFSSDHLRAYARKCGFRERGHVVGHEWMPNFSLHLWQATETAADACWYGPPASSCCGPTAQSVRADMARLDGTLSDLARDERAVAVFGVNEVFALARAYSRLGDFPLRCGLEDRSDNGNRRALPFPVLKPEDAASAGVQDVVVAVNRVYYTQVLPRLKRLGLNVYPVLN